MPDFRRITKGGPRNDKGGGRYLCAATLLAFMLSAGLFLSACGGGGSGGGMTPDPGNGNGGEGPAVTVSFGAVSYSVAEGESVTVEVTLSADPERSVAIPVTVDSTSTAATEDYSLEPASVTFASGDISKSITLTAAEDTENEPSEDVILNFGMLPERVSAGTTTSTTVTINDPCEDADHTVTGGPGSAYDNRRADGVFRDADGEGLLICGNEVTNEIKGGPGPDTILGGGGDDDLQGRAGDDVIDGGPGADTAIYRVSGENDESVTLEALDISLEDGEAANDGHGNMDTLISIENITCNGISMSSDTGTKIVGNDEDNDLMGCNNLAAGNLIIALGGDDTIRCSLGNNYYDGGEGRDALECSGSGGLVDLGLVEDGESTHPDDTGKYGKIYAGGSVTVYAKLEDRSETTAGMGNTNIENLIGGLENDMLAGDADDNILDGSEGADTLTGRGGNDTLIGGPGADTLTGGPGDDTYYAEVSDTAVTEAAGEGDDTVYYTGTGISHGVTYNSYNSNSSVGLPPANIETVIGTENNDNIRARAGGVTVVGGAGDDRLMGGAGADTLIGCGGKDRIYSNAGSATENMGSNPYAHPGYSGDGQINTFVIVSGDDAIDGIREFTTNDKIILAGFPAGTARGDVTAAAAANSDLSAAGLTTITTGDSAEWTDLEVSGTTVAFVKGLATDFPQETDSSNNVTKTVSQVLASHLTDSTNQSVEVDQSYDTGCP